MFERLTSDALGRDQPDEQVTGPDLLIVAGGGLRDGSEHHLAGVGCEAFEHLLSLPYLPAVSVLLVNRLP
jgi:hypothetical protein